jgi:hypothetical protein
MRLTSFFKPSSNAGKGTRLMLGLLACLVLLIQSVPSCSAARASTAGLHSAWDLLRLAEMIDSGFSDSGGNKLGTAGTETSLNDLRNGLCQAVLLGREPTAEELEGFTDTVIAYDGVCILVDENSYIGGEIKARGPTGQKTDGLRNLGSADLAQILSYWNVSPDQRWELTEGFYRRVYPVDFASSFGYKLIDPETGEDLGEWVADYPILKCFCFPVGKYDTQTVLFQALGLDEKDITANCYSFTTPDLYREEEVLSYEYMPGVPYSTDMGNDFTFKLGFASLRTAIIAMLHIPVKVVAIDGIDPVENPAAIYDGSYPLSRKIHILTKADPSPEAEKLVQYLLSADGQALIESKGYLPLPDNSVE